jgi:hypothetical protein
MFTQERSQGAETAGPFTLARLVERWRQERRGEKEVELTDVLADESGLTEAGRLLIQLLAARETRPHYDATRRELQWRGRLVKRLKRAGCNQTAVLIAFENLGWPARIENPLESDGLTDTKAQLRETVRALNAGQEQDARIQFHSDDGGVRWQAAEWLGAA